MLIIPSVLFGILLLCLAVLQVMSPGKPRPILDTTGQPLPGSISEKIFIEVNGTRQGMFIRGRDIRNPVLLYLHGGMPDYFLNEKYPTGLEEYFTVAWWEQRGAGISFSPELPAETLTVEQFMDDTLAVADYLRGRFGQDKIYLMGHSGGSFIGIQAAAQSPERFHAYIGMAQMSNTIKSEKLAYDYMLAEFRKLGDEKMVRRLEAAPVTLEDGLSDAYKRVRDTAMHKLGVGTTHDMRSVVSGLFFPSLAFPEYTLAEKVNFWRAKAQTGVSAMWDAMAATDLSQQVRRLEIPVYFLEGIYDYTCSYSEALAFFEKLEAPVKGFYTFNQSAHSPVFEEPALAREIILTDVLAGANTLADFK